jgi:hypothetical protein
MKSLLYLIAVILIVGWALGVFFYGFTGFIHALPILAIIALVGGRIDSAKSTESAKSHG